MGLWGREVWSSRLTYQGDELTKSAQITAMMIVKDEADRYLKLVLNNLSRLVDKIVILDDASRDGTYAICRSYAKVVRCDRMPQSLFSVNESELRKRLWELTVSTKPDWILAVDADEVFEERAFLELPKLVDTNTYNAVEFRLFDFWTKTHYRVDGAWNPWQRFNRMLFRYDPDTIYHWPNAVIHCGRIPLEIRPPHGIGYQSDLRIKHLGWIRPKDRLRRFQLYANKDKEVYGKVQQHTASIMYPERMIVLEEWIELGEGIEWPE